LTKKKKNAKTIRQLKLWKIPPPHPHLN